MTFGVFSAVNQNYTEKKWTMKIKNRQSWLKSANRSSRTWTFEVVMSRTRPVPSRFSCPRCGLFDESSSRCIKWKTEENCEAVVTFSPSFLRGSDCKYRESADKLKKSKILITCQKNTFGELSSKILLKPSGILLFSGNSEKRFCLIYYAIIRLKIKQIENACFKTVCNARKQF